MMLEQEIEKYLSGQTLCNCDSVSYHNIKNLILGFTEQETKDLKETINGLREQLALRYDLEDKITGLKETNKRISDECHKLVNSLEKKQNEIVALKAQIERMKCCYNCKHSRTEYEHCRTSKHEKWELKEN